MTDLYATERLHKAGFAVKNSRHYFEMYEETLSRLPFSTIDHVTSELLNAFERASCVFLFGNGGSAALASHFACDLAKGTITNGRGRRFRVMALTDNIPIMTAWANDSCYDEIFSEQLNNFIEPNDIAFAISASGNSPNVLRGLYAAREAGARAIGLTGFEGGKMKALCDLCVVVPSDNMQIIEDLHLSVAHAIFSVLRRNIAQANRQGISKVAGAFD